MAEDKGIMSRRDFIKSSLAYSAAVAGLPQLSAHEDKQANQRPNLVFVCADQLRYMSCGFGGDKRAITPNIDRFASEGVNFRNAVSGYPVCAAYRASLLTGKYSSSTGMVINEIRMNPNHESIAHVLRRGGYQADYIGKWHLWGNIPGAHGDMSTQFVPPGPDRLGFDDYWAGYNFNHSYNHGFYFEDTPERIDVKGYEPDVQTDMAIERIKKCMGKGKPYSLFLSYGTPHDPWDLSNVPKEYAEMFNEADFPLPENYADGSAEYWLPNANREWWMTAVKPNLPRMQRLYYAMMANLDWNFGRLLKAIDESGERDNTIVVFTSDHGEMFGAHGRVAKITFYEEAANVPLLVRWPRHIPAYHTSDACINTPDIMPTFLGLVGLQVPQEVEGEDLSHCALGRPGHEPEAALLQGMGHTFLWEDGFEWRALRDKRYTYAITRADKKEYLFDRKNDPLQMQNLINDPKHAKEAGRFREMLKSRLEALNDNFEACTWYRDHWTRDRVIARSATLKESQDSVSGSAKANNIDNR